MSEQPEGEITRAAFDTSWDIVESLADAVGQHEERLTALGMMGKLAGYFFHCLGATVANFILSWGNALKQPELYKRFRRGFDEFIEFLENEGEIDDRKAAMKLFHEVIDANGRRN